MKKGIEGTICISYLRERCFLLLFYVMAVLIFLALAGLYEYDNSVVNMMYAALLVAFLGLCAAIPDFIIYRNRCRRLYTALASEGERDRCLPAARNLPEKLYYEITGKEEAEKRNLMFELDDKKSDMSDYYTMWTHQIKTPIAAMRLILQREAQEAGSAGADKEGAGAGADRNKQALNELFKIDQYAEMALHYARLDSMSADMLFRRYDIAHIIRQAVKKYAVLFIGSGLSFSLGEFECKAVTDEKWLSFVMEQLLSNALKYTPCGGISIYGADESGAMREGEVSHVAIEDTGIGIRQCDLPRIFERGFTGYNGRMDKKSTGIGLYLCRQIMDRLSHTIKVKAAPGEGTQVLIGFVQESNVTKM